MYDMTLQDVAVMPKILSVYHWMEGGASMEDSEVFGKSIF